MNRFYPALALCAAGVAAACGSSSEPAVPLLFDASVQPLMTATTSTSGKGTAQSVSLTVTIFNPDSRPRILQLREPCSATLRVYTSPARSGTAAWDSESLPGGCKSVIRADTVPGRDSVHVASGVFGYNQMLTSYPSGPTIPPGHYYFGAYVASPQLPNGSALVQAGEGDLGLTLH